MSLHPGRRHVTQEPPNSEPRVLTTWTGARYDEKLVNYLRADGSVWSKMSDGMGDLRRADDYGLGPRYAALLLAVEAMPCLSGRKGKACPEVAPGSVAWWCRRCRALSEEG